VCTFVRGRLCEGIDSIRGGETRIILRVAEGSSPTVGP
jgi:hypothetical protein